jgi:hypothetical protein
MPHAASRKPHDAARRMPPPDAARRRLAACGVVRRLLKVKINFIS